ncbi:GNAT family N-acetyltransferase [Anaerocolumna sp. AGMB13025]|uniref:GNAT family N-acetyltransferase n=1 Tax=Anaerocolumna sp. AGMB13025 TaxID=3039116 RepID=UPI00241D3B87|nr:GNAT family N-acetyltransferase [Anaerocolumna sp. AGMB13025]WFR57750.1 GNAT family N-acetyltransferase [Anaerocolumna sp. AGMB13025]
MEQIYFETERLIVRQWSFYDIPALFDIMSNDFVHTYAEDSAWDMEKTENYIRYMIDRDFKTLELFHGAVVLKGSNKIIGRTGLNPYKEKQPEIEWKLGVGYWGKGYATELGRAIIGKAFAATDISCIYGMAHPDNIASRKVLEKIGMECIGLHKFRNNEDMFYVIKKVN